MSIYLIGLGAKQGDLSLSAYNALKSADFVYACSEDALPLLPSDIKATLKNGEIVPDVLNEKNAAYCVKGAVSDHKELSCLAALPGVFVFEGVSQITKYSLSLQSENYTLIRANMIGSLKSCQAVIVYDLDKSNAQDTQNRLLNIFGNIECICFLGDEKKHIKVSEIQGEITKCEKGKACAVAVEQSTFFERQRYDFDDLEYIVKLLRAPDGCPWDRVQTNESIKENMIEEAYELVDAIEHKDDNEMIEEAGDVLLQAVFHAVMREEDGAFSNSDMITYLVKKLIFRHSHIFGLDKASTESEALGVWEKNKSKEKSFETYGDSVAAVSHNLPACMRAQKIQKRSAKSGMDFLSAVSAAERFEDELGEMILSLVDGDMTRVFDECGDILFSAVNTCRLAGVDCEEALAHACDKFTARFIKCEQLVLSDGKKMNDLNELELDWYWHRAKND